MNLYYIFGALFILFFGFVVFIGAPYVPSQKKYVKSAFKNLYPLNKNDVLLDIGSGGGVVLRLASKCGARAIGYEINPFLVVVSKVLSMHDSNVSIKLVDFWLVDIPSDTTVIYLFAVARDMPKIYEKIQSECNRLGRVIDVISYGNNFSVTKETKKLDAYYLYQFHPLHSGKAQV